ncbi:MAG: hypothetical protein WA941_23715 [Nitrososphaeraceae archaeon]
MTKDELHKFSTKFLCQLFKKTGGNLDMSMRSAELVFESVTVGAYERPSLAASIGNHISHHLLKQGLIRNGYLADEVRLTKEGLQKCIETCRDLY